MAILCWAAKNSLRGTTYKVREGEDGQEGEMVREGEDVQRG